MRCRRARTLASIVAVVAFSLLAGGCGGAGSPGVASVAATSTVPSAAGSAATTSGTQALRAAGRCLRQHGLPNLPDPFIATSGPAQGQAVLDKQALRSYPETVVNQAVDVCRAALEKAGFQGGPNAAASPREIQNLLAFARCVRNHGISNFPDPDSQGNFNFAGTGINPHSLSPAELHVARTCLPTSRGAVHVPQQDGATRGNG